MSTGKGSDKFYNVWKSFSHCLFSNRRIAHDIKNRVQGININDTAFKFSEYATKVAGLMNTEKDDVTKTFKVSERGAGLIRPRERL